jgi:predicted MFS family arabinose efflux permease
MAIGILEYAWAGSTLVGIPIIGFLMGRFHWHTPFYFLGLSGLISLIMLRKCISGDPDEFEIMERRTPGVLRGLKIMLNKRTSLGALFFAFFVSAANDNLFVVYGAWLENAHHLSIIALGVGTSVIGVAELLGESLTAFFSDRVGLKRSVLLGLIFSSVSYVALPLFEKSIHSSLFGLFTVFFIFEFAIVSFMSLCTELMPESRATMMSGYLAAAGVGRVVGAFLGGRIYLAGGIFYTCSMSFLISVMALVSLAWGLRTWQK